MKKVNEKYKRLVSVFVIVMIQGHVLAQESNTIQTTGVVAQVQPVFELDNENKIASAEEVLLAARQKLEDAERLAAQIVEAARIESIKIEKSAQLNSIELNSSQINDAERDSAQIKKPLVSLDDIKNQLISVEIRDLPLRETLLRLLPSGWRVMIDMDASKLRDQRIYFIAQKSRDEAMSDLTRSLGLQYQYFFQLTDDLGNPTPLLVVTER